MSEQKCVKCGHSNVNHHGVCTYEVPHPKALEGNYPKRYCGCKCEFSEASASEGVPERLTRSLDASKEYVRGLEELARDVATMPMDALMDDAAPRSALMNVVSLLRHLQKRSRALISQHQETK